MSKENQTLLRQWNMLRMIPRYPQKVTASVITEKLAANEFEVSKRTVERDLNELSRTFPLSLDDRNKPYGWSWTKEAPSFDLPGLSSHEALMLTIAEDYIKTLLPSITTEVLSPHFSAAKQALKTLSNHQKIGHWRDKVRSISPNQPLIAPTVDPEVQRVLSTGLLEEKQLEITYQKLGETEAHEHRIHPLGLVNRGNLSYLVVTFYDYKDICLLATHRIKSAEVLEQNCIIPNGFDLDQEIERGRLNFGEGNMIKLVAEFKKDLGEYFYETPISADQEIEILDAGKLKVTATIADTPQLTWWLLGFGAGVEIKKPTSLREGLIKKINLMAELYQR